MHSDPRKQIAPSRPLITGFIRLFTGEAMRCAGSHCLIASPVKTLSGACRANTMCGLQPPFVIFVSLVVDSFSEPTVPNNS
jgi:hypothetical protein